jgi:hypothetical protein
VVPGFSLGSHLKRVSSIAQNQCVQLFRSKSRFTKINNLYIKPNYLKDFCDSGVTDLTQYLRVGFRLAFHAIPNNTNEWIANYVSPINEQDLANGVVNDGQELNLESIEQNNMPPGKAGKDTYSLEKEMRALAFLLSIFQKNSVHYIPLSK